ncbi:ABC transporter ATP-binding protein [Metabacillus litoralis]|uniref:ABC transporter ATP-binding protein n=1 Tax=Metabacillus litoralis TaxID=152268 RepID=UPI001CFC928E|nr:ABC transporter ATP-binding protein [Metabacillus litoralis]
MAFLETKNLNFTYPDEKIKVLTDISITVEQGDFVVLCGPSGSGKSTFLRLLKQEIAPHGVKEGAILLENQSIADLPRDQVVRDIGMVFQDPENQIVMDHVLEELIFGMENNGAPTEEMRKKVAEIVHFFGIEGLLNCKTHELSGGQKQLVNLASVLLLKPKLLLLDEPTSQLDPVASREFIGMLKTMNEEFGITVIVAEHRLEELFAIADKALVLDRGQLLSYDTPRRVIHILKDDKDHAMYHYLPSPARLHLEYTSSTASDNIPLSVKEGKNWLKTLNILPNQDVFINEDHNVAKKELMKLKEVDFRYSKESSKIINDLSLSIYEGEWLSVVGANGTGKSTLLKMIAGLEKPQRGAISYKGKKLKKQMPKEIGYLPQNPKLFFIHDTIGAELHHLEQLHQIQHAETRIEELLTIFKLKELVHRHPYDVSGGEMQKAALAGVLLPNPKLLLIDEPTKGLDPEAKLRLGKLLKTLQQKGLTIVMVTHDIEFAAQYSTRCAMMFQGSITTNGPTKSFFQGNAFYTTVLNRMTRGSEVPDVLTLEEARVTWHVQE